MLPEIELVPRADEPLVGELVHSDAMEIAGALRGKFRKMERGHHAALHAFLQEVYTLGMELNADVISRNRLRNEEFWRNVRQKPFNWIMKKLLYYVMEATSKQIRDRAGKYAKILELFKQYGLPSDAVAECLEAWGIENIYLNLPRGMPAATPSRIGQFGSNEASSPAPPPTNRLSREPANAPSPSTSNHGDSPETAIHDALFRPTASADGSRDRPIRRRSRGAVRVDPREVLVVRVDPASLVERQRAAAETGFPQTYLLEVTFMPPNQHGEGSVTGAFREVRDLQQAAPPSSSAGSGGAARESATSTQDPTRSAVASPNPPANSAPFEIGIRKSIGSSTGPALQLNPLNRPPLPPLPPALGEGFKHKGGKQASAPRKAPGTSPAVHKIVLAPPPQAERETATSRPPSRKW